MLSIQGVSKTFNPGSPAEKNALSRISLELCSGEFVTVIGGNGAGKSTLLNIIAGVHPVDEGLIIIDGQPVQNLPEHLRAAYIGRVFQDPVQGTAASMTIEENLSIAQKRGSRRKLRRAVKSRDRSYYREKLSLLGLGLENRLDTRVGLLSGGQRQALTLLMATLIPPQLLLLDEHTAALDPYTAPVVLELTEKFVRENSLTTIMVTHNMEDALRMGDRTVMMHEGQIMLDIAGRQRNNLSVQDLLDMFHKASGQKVSNDRMLLA